MNIQNQRVLITGGASGIGLELAHALGRAGATILITGRREAPLGAAQTALVAAGISAYAAAADVTTAVGRAATIAAASEFMGGLDILINNAGGVRGGRLEKLSEEEILAMVYSNLIGPMLLTRLALPHLRAAGTAMIVNVSSGMGLTGMPFYSVYAGAKAGIARFGDALRRELDGEGIHVMTAYPVATDTPMMQSSQMAGARDSATDVAATIMSGIINNAREVILGGPTRAEMRELDRVAPEQLDARFRGMKPAMEVAVSNHVSL